jgi:hypothetical protein
MSAKKSASYIAAKIKHNIEQGLAGDVGADQHDREIVHGARGPPLPVLSALELEQHVKLERAAEILGIHVETFEATYPHLIRRVSPRCRRVKLRDLLQNAEAA